MQINIFSDFFTTIVIVLFKLPNNENSVEPLCFSFTKQLTCQMASNNNMVTNTGQNLWPCKKQKERQ